MIHDVMKYNVTDTIESNTKTGSCHLIPTLSQAGVDQDEGQTGEEEKVEVIFLKDLSLVVVMIVMETPSLTMHYVLMHESSDKFHSCS
jgi:hypothetical protein